MPPATITKGPAPRTSGQYRTRSQEHGERTWGGPRVQPLEKLDSKSTAIVLRDLIADVEEMRRLAGQDPLMETPPKVETAPDEAAVLAKPGRGKIRP